MLKILMGPNVKILMGQSFGSWTHGHGPKRMLSTFSGLSGPHAHAPCRLKVSLSLKLRCRAPQLPPAALSGQKISQGRKLVKKVKIWKVLRMGLPIVENLSGLQESIFSLSRGPQLHSGEKSKKYRILLNLPISPIPPV